MAGSKQIALVDYGSGNLRSVAKALERVGAEVVLVARADALPVAAAALVVPGVGAFGDCVEKLRESGLWDSISGWLRAGRPYLGICLGYQLLFEQSEEMPDVKGLGWFRGNVRRFPSNGIKVPHIGWNTLDFREPRSPLYRGLPPAPHVYFVHSYFPAPTDPSIVSATTAYGPGFAASVSSGNVHGMQFHPEKSQAVGLSILANFVASV